MKLQIWVGGTVSMFSQNLRYLAWGSVENTAILVRDVLGAGSAIVPRPPLCFFHYEYREQMARV